MTSGLALVMTLYWANKVTKLFVEAQETTSYWVAATSMVDQALQLTTGSMVTKAMTSSSVNTPRRLKTFSEALVTITSVVAIQVAQFRSGVVKAMISSVQVDQSRQK